MPLDTEVLNQWLELEIKQRNLQAEVEHIKQQQAPLEDFIRRNMIDSKVDKVSIGGYTISLGVDRYPTAINGDRAGLSHALRKLGLDEFCESVNMQKLRKWMNDTIEAAQGDGMSSFERLAYNPLHAIPIELRGYLGVSEKYRVRASR